MSLSPPTIYPPRADVPVLISVPHAGRDYPDWLIALCKGGAQALHALEDPLVDDLVERAVDKGIGAVIARTPRAAVDCNRAEDEIDPTVIRSGPIASLSARARGGLGIVPGRTATHGPTSALSASRRSSGSVIGAMRDPPPGPSPTNRPSAAIRVTCAAESAIGCGR